MTAFVNPAVDPAAVPPPGAEAASFHAGLRGYRPTPVHVLGALARELGLGSVTVKDESDRLGLPSFKALGASWAIERTVRERPDVHTLIAASAGNHGRAVAHIAATRGLRCRVFLPARAVAARRAAIATEGAEVIVLDGDYEDAVTAARNAALDPGPAEIADVATPNRQPGSSTATPPCSPKPTNRANTTSSSSPSASARSPRPPHATPPTTTRP